MGLGYKYAWRGTRKKTIESNCFGCHYSCVYFCAFCVCKMFHQTINPRGNWVSSWCCWWMRCVLHAFQKLRVESQVIQSQLLRWLLFKRNLMLYLLLLFHSKDYCFNRRHKKGEFKFWISMIQSHFIIELDLTGILSLIPWSTIMSDRFLVYLQQSCHTIRKKKKRKCGILKFFLS